MWTLAHGRGDDGDRTRGVTGIDETTEHVLARGASRFDDKPPGGHPPLLILSVDPPAVRGPLDLRETAAGGLQISDGSRSDTAEPRDNLQA